MATRALPRSVPAPRAPARPALRVVRGTKKVRRRAPVAIVVLAVITVFGVTGMHASMGQDGLRAATLEREVQEETERLSLLRARVAQLSTPRRIAEEAARAGLVPDQDPSFLHVGGAETAAPQAGGLPNTPLTGQSRPGSQNAPTPEQQALKVP